MFAHLRQRVRWHVKKAARRTVALIAWGSGCLALLRLSRRGPSVRVLTYHRFREAPLDPFSVSLRQFENQMRWLAEHGRAVSVRDLEAFLAGERTLADGSVVVTVDDGFRDFYTEALPIMQRLGVPAVAFVPVGEIMERTDGSQGDVRLSWTDLRELASAGIDIGSHAWDHQSLGAMSRDEARLQARRSRDALESRLGIAVRTFAYPFGTRADYSSVTGEVLHEAGYTCAFVAQHGAVRLGCNRYELPRVKIEGGEGLWMFRLIVNGALDAWSWVDRTLWRLQQGGGRGVEGGV